MNPKQFSKGSSRGADDSRGVSARVSSNRARSKRLVGVLALVCTAGLTASGQYSRIRIPPGYVQVEGDIIMTESNAKALLAETGGMRPKFAYAPSRLWPN